MSGDPAAPRAIPLGSPLYPPALRALGEAAPPLLVARGDPALLRHPLLALFCSARVPAELVIRLFDLARRLRDDGVPVIGGFHAPLERQMLDFLLRGAQPVVVCPARGIERMRLPRDWRDALAAGRLLLLSPFPARLRRPTRALADARNRLVAGLAGTLLVAHAEPGGRTARLAEQALRRGTPVLTLGSPANADLLLLGARPLEEALPPGRY